MPHCLALITILLSALMQHATAQSPDTTGGSFNCTSALARPTVVIYAGLEAPWLGDLTTLMPTHTVNISDGAVTLLSLNDSTMAACAKSIKDIADTLILWEDGQLPSVQDRLPSGLVRTQPHGQLIIKGKQGRTVPGGPDNSGLNNLGFLSKLQSIGGLSVYDMDGLLTLRGLSSLKEITGDLIVSENDNLNNMTGLNALQVVAADVLINSNMNLKTLDGLGALKTIGGQLLVKGNGNLMNLDALSSLQSIGTKANFPNNGNLQMRLPPDIAVGPNASVATGAPGVAPVVVIYGGSVPPTVAQVISACDTFMPPLTKFDMSQQRIKYVHCSQRVPTGPGGQFNGHLIVYDDGNVSSLRPALSAVTNVTGSLIIVGGQAVGGTIQDPGITSLDGLGNIQTVGDLGIIGLTQLLDLDGLSSLRYISKNLVVQFTPNFTSLAGLGAAVGGLSVVGGEVWIEGNLGLVNLTGLENLSIVGWKLSLIHNPALEDLEGLRSLERAGGGLVILENYALTSLAGLHSLQAVGGPVSLMWNTNLTDVDGLTRLTQLPGDFVLAGNPLNSVAALTNLKTVGLQFVISNTNLTDMSGLSALTTVGGGVSFNANKQLTSLNGLNALKEVGDDLSIRQSSALTTLSPMDATLQSVGGGVYIEDNPSLASLGKLSDTITGVGGLVTVRRNGAVPSPEIAALRSKSAKMAAVPDTVALLPDLIAQASVAQMMSAEDSALLTAVMLLSANGTVSGSTGAGTLPPLNSTVGIMPSPSAIQAFG